MMHNVWCNVEEVPFLFFQSNFKITWATKRDDLNPMLSKITMPVAAIKSLRFALFNYNEPSVRESVYSKHIENDIYLIQ